MTAAPTYAAYSVSKATPTGLVIPCLQASTAGARQVQVTVCSVEFQGLDQRDHTGVQCDEVNDRPGDVGNAEIAATPPGRHRHADDLLALNAGGDCRVAEQGLRDTEAIHHAAQPLGQQVAADGENRETSQEPRQRPAPFLGLLPLERLTAGAGEAEDRYQEPDDEQRAVDPGQLAIEREQQERYRRRGGPQEGRAFEVRTDGGDEAAEPRHANRQERCPAEAGACRGSG